MRHPIIGYGPAIRGSRHAFYASSLLEAYQATLRAAREGVVIQEWTWGTDAGRKLLGLDPGQYYLPADELRRPKGLVRCPDGPCEDCRWSGERR